MGNRFDLFEKESVLKAVLNLTFPSIIGQIILVIYNMSDTLFVGMSKSDEMITTFPAYGIVVATPVTDTICCIIALILFVRFMRTHSENKYRLEEPKFFIS